MKRSYIRSLILAVFLCVALQAGYLSGCVNRPPEKQPAQSGQSEGGPPSEPPVEPPTGEVAPDPPKAAIEVPDGKAQSSVQSAISRLRSSLNVDFRENVFDVSCTVADGKAVLTGEISETSFRDALLTGLKDVVPGLEYTDNVVLLPGDAFDGRNWGIVRFPVVDLGDAPNSRGGHSSVTQARMGDIVKLLRTRGGWYQVQMEDKYLGWVSAGEVWTTDVEPAKGFFAGEVALVTAKNTTALDGPAGTSLFPLNLVQGTVLPVEGSQEGFTALKLPDGRLAYVNSADIAVYPELGKVFAQRKDAQSVLETAKQYVGMEYLFAGTTSYGFDCSGLTQYCLKMNGYFVRRDADLQYAQGDPVDMADLIPGDLVFFSTNGRSATHVGFYMGDTLYIHSAGTGLAINSFDPSHPGYLKARNDTYLGARRIIK